MNELVAGVDFINAFFDDDMLFCDVSVVAGDKHLTYEHVPVIKLEHVRTGEKTHKVIIPSKEDLGDNIIALFEV